MAFIGNKDVDRAVLLELDDYDLASICKTNKYFKLLCSEELLWKTKTLKRFGPHLGDITQIQKYMEKYNYKTWKSYYISLIDFLEKKYLGYFLVLLIEEADEELTKNKKIFLEYVETILKRNDIRKLNTITDDNDIQLYNKIGEFLFDADEKEGELNREEFYSFIHKLLDKDSLNPNSIFVKMLRYYSYEKYFKIILEYLLTRQDRRIHPEYFENELLENLATYPYDQNEDGEEEYDELFQMVLDDSRIDPNSFLYKIVTNAEIPPHFNTLVVIDPRTNLDDIKKTIKNYIKLSNNRNVNGLLQLFEAFLQKGGSLFELENIVENESTDNIVYYRSFIRNVKNNLYLADLRKSKMKVNTKY
jgi:hypothetical protein